MPKVKVPWLCSRSQPGIKVIIRDIRGHLLHTVTFLVLNGIWRGHPCPMDTFSSFYQI